MVDVADTGFLPRLSTPEPCHVLVVDDDELIRAHLVALLKLDGYQVHDAGSGAEALLMLAATPCQIVLTDWVMPDMDGLSLCRALRLRDSERHTYVLLLTVRGNPSDMLVGLGAGADDYVVKGAPTAELLARVAVGRRMNARAPSLPIGAGEDRPSMTDPLTGAHSRHFLTKYLPRELERAGRYGHPLSILRCDIDNLQRINDGYGQEAGDQVLQAFVALSLAGMRESIDWIVRVAGEEFVIVLPETTLEGASKVADRVHLALRNRGVATSLGAVHATVSIGGTAVETAHELASVTVAKLLLAADRCLQLSKQQGRDRSTCLTPARADQLTSH